MRPPRRPGVIAPGARRAAMPGFVEPCHPKIGVPPEEGQWAHEIKFDGYRLQAHIGNSRITLFTRRGFDWTNRFASLAAALSKLPAQRAILDGELVVPDENGIPDFHLLEADIAAGRDDRMVYYTFDVLYPMLGENARSELAAGLGAATADCMELRVDDHQCTTIPGLYAVGDVVQGLNQISVAAGQAAVAATRIHNQLPPVLRERPAN